MAAQKQKGGKNYQVISPPNMLNKRVMIKGDGAIDFAAIERAEKALEQLSGEFDTWMSDELSRLVEARNSVREKGSTSETIDALFHCAHDIKGQAATLGYPLAAEAANSLCMLLEKVSDPARLPAVLIDQHVDSIAAIVNQAGRTAKHELASVLLGKLRTVTLDYITQEQKRAPKRDQKADTAA